MAAATPPVQVRVNVAENSGAGKTALVQRFCLKKFKHTAATVATDHFSVMLDLGGTAVQATIWDTAGHEKYRAITGQHYRKADAIVFVFDLTHRPSFTALNEWKEFVDQSATRATDCVIVGTKSDMSSRRVVTDVEARMYALSLGMVYIEASAVDDIGVTEAFLCVAERATSRLLADHAARRAGAAAGTFALTAEGGAGLGGSCCGGV